LTKWCGPPSVKQINEGNINNLPISKIPKLHYLFAYSSSFHIFVIALP
jgi:hypothetical protein